MAVVAMKQLLEAGVHFELEMVSTLSIYKKLQKN